MSKGQERYTIFKYFFIKQHFVCGALLGLLVGTETAYAEEGDATKAYAMESVRHESNFFRLSPSQNSQSLIGRSSPAVTIYTSTLGLKFDKEYSLQRVQIDISAVDYRYQNFSYLNFTALNYRAGLRWSVTPHFYGNFVASQEKTLNDFSDFNGFNQRNTRINTSAGVNATYEMGANWKILGSLTETEQTNRQPLTTESGSRQTVADTGLRYEFPSGTYMGFALRNYDGTYTDQAPSLSNRLESAFTQNEGEMNMLWKLSEKTSASAALIYLTRHHPNFPERNYSGLAGYGRATWLISAKSSLNAEWRREISAYQTASFNFSKVDRFSIGPTWQISAKTRLGMQLSLTNRDYGGSPGIGVISNLNDTSRDAAVAIDWRPVTSLVFIASLQNSRRSASDPTLDYKNNTLAVSAKFSF